MLIYESNTNTLQHHGVKGMKWGVRKARKKTYVSNVHAHKNADDAMRKARLESLAKDKAASRGGQRITAYQAGRNMRLAAQQAKRDSIEADRNHNRQLRDYDYQTYGRDYTSSWLSRNGKTIAAGVVGAAGALVVANILKKKGFGVKTISQLINRS